MRKTVNLLYRALTLFVVTSAYAEPPTPLGNCSAQITQIDSMTQQFQRLNFNVERDQERGLEKDVEAIKLIESFNPNKVPAHCRTDLWKAIVRLAIAQAPFDMESQGATLLAMRLSQDRELNSAYRATLKQSADPCRSKLLSTVTEEKLCQLRSNPNRMHDPEEDPSCRSTFNYEECKN